MTNDVTHRFIECYKELRYLEIVKSDRQFCHNLDFTPQSWNKILKREREVTLSLLENGIRKFNFNPLYIFHGVGDKFLREDETKINIDNQNANRIIHVPLTAKAGYTEHYNSAVYAENLESYSLPGNHFKYGNFRSFEVEGDSMEPVLTNGEIVICSSMDDKYLWRYNIKSGYVYVIIFNNDILVKRVHNLIEKENKLILVSDNSDYPEIDVNVEDIKEVWFVRIKMSTFAHSKINLRQDVMDQYLDLRKGMNINTEKIDKVCQLMEQMLKKQRFI